MLQNPKLLLKKLPKRKQPTLNSSERIALGMSGGVDSSTSAALLLRAGYDVVGVTLMFTDLSERDIDDARSVCDSLGIEHRVHDCRSKFSSCIVKPFIDDYAAGVTPSPCVRCNAVCKIPELLEVAQREGCGRIATGHYARIARLNDSGRFVVKMALDRSKDQSYMLSLLSQEQLSKLILPLGALNKNEVRFMAEDEGLRVADKPDSQDVCFFSGDVVDFLEASGVSSSTGDIVDTKGAIRGKHGGLHRYTLGQRKGIGVASSRPFFVIGKDVAHSKLIIGHKEDAAMTSCVVDDFNWQSMPACPERLECSVRLRYRSTPCGAVVTLVEGEGPSAVRIELLSPQTLSDIGQYAVLSLGDTIIGGGMISSVGLVER